MKKTRKICIVLSMLLVYATALNMAGCSSPSQAYNMTESIVRNVVSVSDDLSSYNETVTDFAVRLFKASKNDEKNVLISPLSVLCALSMTAGGAEKETLAQMEAVLGMKTEELNMYICSYMKNLPLGKNIN